MENQKSAVEWLAKNLKDFPHVKHSQLFRDLVQQAKEMEKQQIIDAFDKGLITENVYYGYDDKKAEQYYNETFKSE
jgi:hypothetical protein